MTEPSHRTPRLLMMILFVAGTGCHTAGATPAEHDSPGPTDRAIDQAAWLAGHWRGEGLDGVNETLWSPPEAGVMMGAYRHMKEGRVVFYEFMTLRPRGDGLVLAIKHFNPDMTGWEERTRSVEFPLLRAEGDALHFDGMTYRRKGPDEREVTVMLGPDAESLSPHLFTYRRVRSNGGS